LGKQMNGFSLNNRSGAPRDLLGSTFAHKVFETYGTQILLLALGLVTTVLVTRTLGPEGRGLYAVMIATGRLAVQFCSLGLHVSNTYYVAKNRQLLPILLSNALGVSFGIGGLCAVVAGTIFYFRPEIAPLPGKLLVLALFWVPFGLAYLLMQNLLLGILEVRAYNTIELVNRMIYLAIVGGLVLCHVLTVEAAFLTTLAVLVFSLGWTILRLRQFMNTAFPLPSVAVFKENFGVGFRAYLISILGFLVLRIDLLMVKYILGSEQAGYYSVAAAIADYVLLLPTVVASILFPKLSANITTEAKMRFAKRATAATGAVLLPLAITAVVAGKPIIRSVFGPAFMPSAVALIWLSPGIVALGIEIVVVQFLNSVGYPAILVGAWLASTVLNIALNLWAIPTYGIMGASAVSSLTYSVMCILVLAMVLKGKYRAERVELSTIAVES
jgi:O-antigen/teichoic acid export membrane protein